MIVVMQGWELPDGVFSVEAMAPGLVDPKSVFGLLCYLNTSFVSRRCFGISPFLEIATAIISTFRPFGVLPIKNYKNTLTTFAK